MYSSKPEVYLLHGLCNQIFCHSCAVPIVLCFLMFLDPIQVVEKSCNTFADSILASKEMAYMELSIMYLCFIAWLASMKMKE